MTLREVERFPKRYSPYSSTTATVEVSRRLIDERYKNTFRADSSGDRKTNCRISSERCARKYGRSKGRSREKSIVRPRKLASTGATSSRGTKPREPDRSGPATCRRV